jgi:hypothetical protein
LQSGRCLDPADPSKPQVPISFLFGLPFCRRTKDGGTLRTVLDARAYMLRYSRERERSAQWQRAAQLVLAKADVGAFSRQLELALLYDGKLDLSK